MALYNLTATVKDVAGHSTTATIPITVTSTTGTILIQESFEDTNFTNRGWYDNTSMVVTSSQFAPGGSTKSLECHFLVGATTPTWGNAARHLFTPTETLYISYWVKYSSRS